MLETTLLALCLVWTVGVVAGLSSPPLRVSPRAVRTWHLGFLVVAGTVGTVIVAGNEYRWPLLPAYLFLIVTSFTAALRLGGEPREAGAAWKRWTLRALLVAVTAGVVAVPLWILPAVRYERPTGPLAVGTRQEFWVDSSRGESFTPDPSDHRRLLVQVWYPADAGEAGQRVRAHPFPRELALGLAGGQGPAMLMYDGMGRGLTWAMADVPVSGAARTFPLLIFSHGFGGTRVQNNFQMAELASHGYVIASVEHTHTALGTVFPGGDVVHMRREDAAVLASDTTMLRVADLWAADGRFVIDRMFALARNDPRGMLAGRIDTTRVGYFGHSFGGATAANVMATDPRVAAGINFDGYLAGRAGLTGLDRPFLQVRSDTLAIDELPEELLAQAGVTRERLRAMLKDWKARTRAVVGGGGHDLHLVGSGHMNYSDMPLWSAPLLRMGRQAGPINVRRAHRIINALTIAWFDRHLKGKAEDPLTLGFPELVEVPAPR